VSPYAYIAACLVSLRMVAAPKAPGHPLRVARQVVIYLPSQKQQILSL